MKILQEYDRYVYLGSLVENYDGSVIKQEINKKLGSCNENFNSSILNKLNITKKKKNTLSFEVGEFYSF